MVRLNNNEINDALDAELGKEDRKLETLYEKIMEQREEFDANELLERGIEKHDIESVNRAIIGGADINGACRLYGDYSGSDDYASALCLAVKNAAYKEVDKKEDMKISLQIVDKLISEGADVDKDNPLASVAFIQRYNTEKTSITAETLLKAGAKINEDTISELLKGDNHKLLDTFIEYGYTPKNADLEKLLKRESAPNFAHHSAVKKMMVSILEANPQTVKVLDEYVKNSKPYGPMDASYTVIEDQRWHTYPEIQTAMRLAKVKNAQEHRDELAGVKADNKTTTTPKQTPQTTLSVQDIKNAKNDLVK